MHGKSRPAMSAKAARPKTSRKPEHFDVLIVGAGISGVGAAYHLTKQCPGKTFVAFDMQESFGGTWWTHRYPGIRSDSDLHTFGYRFKPWRGPPIATAEEILAYMGEVIEENDLASHIRYRHKILSAEWSSQKNLWSIEAIRTDTRERLRITAKFLWMCQGYYRHAQGYMPEWSGMDSFAGQLVHAETWPETLDCTGKKVVVIGSGATAATLIPAIAGTSAHVTMLQRSPTFFITGRNVNDLAQTLRQLQVDEAWVHEIVRRKILYDQAVFTRRCIEEPDVVTKELIGGVRTFLGPDYDVDKHFTPSYRPWRQRIAFIPDGDLFQAIASGSASVVTDEIDRFDATGIALKSGQHLDADIVIAATGFNINVLGDIDFIIDGEPLDFSDTVTYRGMMFTGMPNLAWVFGYFRASWTLRSDMVADFVCQLLNHMEETGAKKVSVALRSEDRDMPLLPWVDTESFNPGYITRALHLLPKRGDKPEWQHSQDYWSEKDQFQAIDLRDPAFVYD
jgi:cation diffusion facilitator CzcD-associated flavoprotein CzcO